MFLGYDAFGGVNTDSYLPVVQKINFFEMRNCIIDEIHIKEPFDLTEPYGCMSDKEEWGANTILLAKFIKGSLEAGNIENNGVPIKDFVIRRRKLDGSQNVIIGKAKYVENKRFEYVDYTQGNDIYIYSLTPVGSGGLGGVPNEVEIESDFDGWWVVHRSENGNFAPKKILAFDKFIDSDPMVNTQFNQGRTQIDTFSRFPNIFYTGQEYHEFTLTTVFEEEGWNRTGHKYNNIIRELIQYHEPMIIKASDGRLFICDISNPQVEAPMNTYKEHDYMIYSIDATEIEDYDEYMNRVWDEF